MKNIFTLADDVCTGTFLGVELFCDLGIFMTLLVWSSVSGVSGVLHCFTSICLGFGIGVFCGC